MMEKERKMKKKITDVPNMMEKKKSKKKNVVEKDMEEKMTR